MSMRGFGDISTSESDSEESDEERLIPSVISDEDTDDERVIQPVISDEDTDDERVETKSQFADIAPVQEFVDQPEENTFDELQSKQLDPRYLYKEHMIEKIVNEFPDNKIQQDLKAVRYNVINKLYKSTNKLHNDENYAASLLGEYISTQRNPIQFIKQTLLDKKYDAFYYNHITLQKNNIPYILYRYSKYMRNL